MLSDGINQMDWPTADVGEQHCPGHDLVSLQSGFYLIDFISCPDSVRILRKKRVRCLSYRSDKDETEVNSERCPDFWYDCPPTPDGQSLTASVFNVTDLLGTKCF